MLLFLEASVIQRVEYHVLFHTVPMSNCSLRNNVQSGLPRAGAVPGLGQAWDHGLGRQGKCF